MLMLDLFAGLGGASQAMRDRGWDVVTVDNDRKFGCTETADLKSWRWRGRTPDLVWASPPCTEFSRESMPWCRTGKQPSLELVHATIRIIEECRPKWWVIENVRGSIAHLEFVLGETFSKSFGPYFLWGRFPEFCATNRKRKKESFSSLQVAERAKIPYELGLALAKACEHQERFFDLATC